MNLNQRRATQLGLAYGYDVKKQQVNKPEFDSAHSGANAVTNEQTLSNLRIKADNND